MGWVGAGTHGMRGRGARWLVWGETTLAGREPHPELPPKRDSAHRDTAHKQKSVSGTGLLPPAQLRTPTSTSLGFCPAEAQPPPRMETFPPQR